MIITPASAAVSQSSQGSSDMALSNFEKMEKKKKKWKKNTLDALIFSQAEKNSQATTSSSTFETAIVFFFFFLQTVLFLFFLKRDLGKLEKFLKITKKDLKLRKLERFMKY